MSALNPEFSISSVNYKNGESVQGAYDISKSVTYHSTLTADTSTDPFAGKTNKYAESALIRVIVIEEAANAALGIHIKADGSGISAADVNDYFLQSGKEYFFLVNSNSPYFRIISTSGQTPEVFVTEIK